MFPDILSIWLMNKWIFSTNSSPRSFLQLWWIINVAHLPSCRVYTQNWTMPLLLGSNYTIWMLKFSVDEVKLESEVEWTKCKCSKYWAIDFPKSLLLHSGPILIKKQQILRNDLNSFHIMCSRFFRYILIFLKIRCSKNATLCGKRIKFFKK